MNSEFKLMLGRNSGATDCLMTKAVFNDPESALFILLQTCIHTYTRLTALCPGLPG